MDVAATAATSAGVRWNLVGTNLMVHNSVENRKEHSAISAVAVPPAAQ